VYGESKNFIHDINESIILKLLLACPYIKSVSSLKIEAHASNI
jgi:hypothetical protein